MFSKVSASIALAQIASVYAQNIAGYAPGSDVVVHSMIDLDQDELAEGPPTEGNFTDMIRAFTVGGNSVKGSGSIRTLQGFSTGLYAKACPDDVCIEPWFQAQRDFFDDNEYGNTIVMAALEGTGDFAMVEDSLRKEVAVKGSAYVVAGMYASHEMEDAIVDCNAGSIASNDDGVHAWDEAVAFYAGSLEGTDAGGNSAGQLSYRLAEKRCANYGTCTGEGGISAVNEEVFELFVTGRDALTVGDCDTAEVAMVSIQSLFLVPQIQGTLRYAFKADPAANDLNGIEDKDASTVAKEQGEGYIFAVGIIGHVNQCDATVATTLSNNLGVENIDAYMGDGYAAVAVALQSVYECLGVTCADIGGLLLSGSDDEYYAGLEPCSDANTEFNSASIVSPLSAAVALVAGYLMQ